MIIRTAPPFHRTFHSLHHHQQHCRPILNVPLSIHLLQQQQQQRTLSSTSTSFPTSVDAALELLNLHHKPHFSTTDLRDAYFNAAKRYHPDSNSNQKRRRTDPQIPFSTITEAYEFLRKRKPNKHSPRSEYQYHKNDAGIHHHRRLISDEEHYREACLEFLGLPAEIVEESKRCPLFRRWLRGNTDAAMHWNRFFSRHGGLAPRLVPIDGTLLLGMSSADGRRDGDGEGSKRGPRRRRKLYGRRKGEGT